jgi:hypothetical protein
MSRKENHPELEVQPSERWMGRSEEASCNPLWSDKLCAYRKLTTTRTDEALTTPYFGLG